ncbi:hypothetical protein CDAR_514891 [Caerostris darwini]|uniref:Uncharacterized protein n=1 Tax=Caerostris darwini TaxID=1538125 RepID=A0AAV4TF31_9ARAC|nr:hypothetical protein CDAR_514891 [Caerostris darwini]
MSQLSLDWIISESFDIKAIDPSRIDTSQFDYENLITWIRTLSENSEFQNIFSFFDTLSVHFFLINLQHPTSANNIPPSTSVTEIPKLITSPSENNQSTSNAPLSNNQDILIIKTLLQDFMSKFSTALEALTAQKSSNSSVQESAFRQ